MFLLLVLNTKYHFIHVGFNSAIKIEFVFITVVVKYHGTPST